MRLLFAGTLKPNSAPQSVHEIRFKQPVRLHYFRVLCDGERPHASLPFCGETPHLPLTIEMFGCEHGSEELCTSLLQEPFLRDEIAAPSTAQRVHHSVRCNYLVIRSDPVLFSLCLYGIEAGDSSPSGSTSRATASCEDLLSFRVLINALERRGSLLVMPERAACQLERAFPGAESECAQLRALATADSSLASSACVDVEAIEAAITALRGATNDQTRLEAIETLKPNLSPMLSLPEEVPQRVWCGVAESLVGVLRCAVEDHDAGLATTIAALDLLSAVARSTPSAMGLSASNLPQVCTQLALDRCSSTPVRRQLLELLIIILHHPTVMTCFLASPPNKGEGEMSMDQDELPPEQSSFRRLMQLFTSPVPVPLVAPLQQICRLVSAWEHATNLRRLAQQALQAEFNSLSHCDAVCEPVLRELREVNHAVLALAVPRHSAEGIACDLSVPLAERESESSCPPAAACSRSGCAHPAKLSDLPTSCTCLNVHQVQLICGTGVWNTVVALLASPHVRQSTMLQPIAAGLQQLTHLMLQSFSSAFELLKEPLASTLGHLLSHVTPLTLTRTLSSQGSAASQGVKQEDSSREGDRAADGVDLVDPYANAKLEAPQPPVKLESTLSAGRELDTEGSWAAHLVLALRDSAHASQCLQRLLVGELDALHTLVCLDPAGCVDAVVVTLASDVGVGALAAVFHSALARSGQNGSEEAATTARYAAILLQRVLGSVRGVHVSWKYGKWLRHTIRSASVAESNDEQLQRLLSTLERLLQPALIARDHGVTCLARCVALLLLGRPPEGMLSSDVELDQSSLEVPSGSFNKGVAAKASWSQEERDRSGEKTRNSILKYTTTLVASLRLLRCAATRKEVALALHKEDCLAWLRALLEQGTTLLKSSSHTDARYGALQERSLLWLLEAAVGTTHAVLWDLASSELSEYHDSALFDALYRLAMVLPELPSAAASMTVRASRQEFGTASPSPRSGSVGEAAIALEKTLLCTLALFFESKWPSCLKHALELSLETPSSSLGAMLLLAQALPPPLPISLEQLSHSLLLMPATSGPLIFSSAPQIWSYKIPSDPRSAVTVQSGMSDGNTPESAPAAAVAATPEPTPGLPAEPSPSDLESTNQALLDALTARRTRWRALLLQASSELREFILALAGCSCQRIAHVLATLLVRVCDLLGVSNALPMIVLPLVELQGALGRCVTDEAAEQPGQAPGDPAIALSRVTLLLAALAAHPTGRACLLTIDPSLLLRATMPTLQPGTVKPACHRGGLLLLKYLCDSRILLPCLTQQPDRPSSPLLPSSALLGGVIQAVGQLSVSPSSGCVLQAKDLISRLRLELSSSTQPALRRLAEAMAEDGSVSACNTTSEGASLIEAEMDSLAGHRSPIWPRAWRAFQTDAELEALFESRESFGAGLVQTGLEYGLPTEPAPTSASSASAKRSRSSADVIDSIQGDAPPPVRGGRGRMREDPAPRGKPTTSRPASKHVDEYAGQGPPKRFQNSSRAPSKHVDEYQPAPVVRKIAPAAGGTSKSATPADGDGGDDGDCRRPLAGALSTMYCAPPATSGPCGSSGLQRMGAGDFCGSSMVTPPSQCFGSGGMPGMSQTNFGPMHMNLGMGGGVQQCSMGQRPGSMPPHGNTGTGGAHSCN